jgi:acyl dehydratase
VDEVRWLEPICPGDRLSLRATVLDTRASRSRPDMGFVRFSFDLFNQRGAHVVALTTSMMMGRRTSAKADP